jgi:uncharacterized integral membrane protein
MTRILTLLVAFPAAVVLVSLAIANRHAVKLVLDPFRPEAPVLQVQLPFYVYIFGALITGVLLGGLATWLNQGRWRRMARARAVEASRWQAEADRLGRERDDLIVNAPRATGDRMAELGKVGAAPGKIGAEPSKALAFAGRR